MRACPVKQTAGDKRIAVAVLTQKISFGWAEYASETNERSKQVKMQTTENGLGTARFFLSFSGVLAVADFVVFIA